MPHASVWSAMYLSWQDEGQCNGVASFDFVPDIETPRGLKRARGWCDDCPVRAECLTYALLYRMKGYWGGTDHSQRRKLLITKDRARCPLAACQSKAVLRVDTNHQVCLSCGASWRGSTPLLPLAGRSAPPADVEDVPITEGVL